MEEDEEGIDVDEVEDAVGNELDEGTEVDDGITDDEEGIVSVDGDGGVVTVDDG